MKTWQAGLLGFGALAAVTTGAFFWTGAGAASADPYWSCMAEYGYSPDTPAGAVESDGFARANAACE